MFKFGKQKPDIKQYAIIGIVLSSIIAVLSQCTGVSEDGLWDLLDEMQRKYFPGTILNEFVIKDSAKLERRIKRDVDRAIDQVTPEYDRIISESNKKYKPKYVEKAPDGSEAQKLLGGEMRICAPFYDSCDNK